MDTNPHTLSVLFEQLGLPSDRASIDAFISTHRLQPGDKLSHAPFWNEAQAAFLRNALVSDDDWAIEVDELAVRLTEGA